jgi:hypothetical protein
MRKSDVSGSARIPQKWVPVLRTEYAQVIAVKGAGARMGWPREYLDYLNDKSRFFQLF